MTAKNWTFTGVKQAGTFTILGQDCLKVTVEMPTPSSAAAEGVDFYIPTYELFDTEPDVIDDGAEGQFVVGAGATVYRAVLQPVLLGDSLGPTAIPASTPAELAWSLIPTMALPAA